MSNQPDVRSREDLQFIVTRFYDQLLVDDLVSQFFSHIHPDDLPHHLDRVVDFWYQILFGGDGYKGNPMKPHFRVHQKHPFTRVHFDRWLYLWKNTIDETYSGTHSSELISRSETIARVMEIKLP